MMKTKMCTRCHQIKEIDAFQSFHVENQITRNCETCRKKHNERQKIYVCVCGKSIHVSNYQRHCRSFYHMQTLLEQKQPPPELILKFEDVE